MAVGGQRLAGGIGPEREPQHEAPEEGLLAQQLRHAVADAQRRFPMHTGGHQAASRTGSAAGSSARAPKYPANFSASASASRLTWARAAGSKVLDGRSASGLDVRDLVLHLLAEPGELVVAEDVEPWHHVHQVADVRDHRVAEHQRLAVAVLAQPLGDALDGLPDPAVKVAHRTVELFLDVALDVALHPLGVVGGELRDEMVGVRYRRNAVADGELALEVFLGRIVLDAEQLAEVEPGLVDVVVVVLDEAGALAHHPLAEPVHQLGVVLVVGDGEKARALVVQGRELA